MHFIPLKSWGSGIIIWINGKKIFTWMSEKNKPCSKKPKKQTKTTVSEQDLEKVVGLISESE